MSQAFSDFLKLVNIRRKKRTSGARENLFTEEGEH